MALGILKYQKQYLFAFFAVRGLVHKAAPSVSNQGTCWELLGQRDQARVLFLACVPKSLVEQTPGAAFPGMLSQKAELFTRFCNGLVTHSSPRRTAWVPERELLCNIGNPKPK